MTPMMVIESLQRMGVTTNSLCLDSRRVQRGDIFVACRGTKHDGRAFISDAVRRGAAAVLYDEQVGVIADGEVPSVAVNGLANRLGEIASLIYGQPSEKMQVVGVTGTNGKTTVSQWIAQSVIGLGRRCAVMGTLGNGFPGQLKESPNTTPDAIAVQSGLAQVLAEGAVACAMEVSSIGLHQGRVNGVTFDTAVLTNLSRDHLDYHGDMSAYAAAKAELFLMPGLKTAVLNLDDAFGVELLQLLRGKVRTIAYTMRDEQGGDDVVAAQNLRMNAAGVEFTIDGIPVVAPVIGRFNVANLLAVFCSLRALGFDARRAAVALAALTPPPGRLQVVSAEKSQPLVMVDYAHTPDALDKALAALREIAIVRGGKLICVFGCGGDRDTGKRPLMGVVAERLADAVVITSDNPRSEAPAHIAQQILDGMKSSPKIELDRVRAIRHAISAADPRDVVLLAGKGHEAYQEIAGIRHPFSDVGVARLALEQRP